jgi:hypothetical protein
MAKTSEIWIVEGMEGITRRQQMQRLAEWKKLFLAEAGASAVNIYEGGYGEYNGAWIYSVEFDSAAAFGASQDKVMANSKSFDDAMDVWQKTPMLKFRGGGIIHQTDI